MIGAPDEKVAQIVTRFLNRFVPPIVIREKLVEKAEEAWKMLF